jgi:nicotinamidase/pyrazinamidase
MRRLVVVVDAQADFMQPSGALPVSGADSLIGPLQDWLGALRPAETAAVLFTFDTHLPDVYAGSAEAAQFPLHCERGTAGWDLVVDPAVIGPAIPVVRLEKHVFDMWAEPDISIETREGRSIPRDLWFARLRDEGVGAAMVVGVAADFCVRWAVEGLVARGFAVTVPEQLTRGILRQIDAVRREEWAGADVALA